MRLIEHAEEAWIVAAQYTEPAYISGDIASTAAILLIKLFNKLPLTYLRQAIIS